MVHDVVELVRSSSSDTSEEMDDSRSQSGPMSPEKGDDSIFGGVAGTRAREFCRRAV
jgi:hypothetical protein